MYMSGETADVIVHQGVLNEGVRFIQKPFFIQELACKVRDALDQPWGGGGPAMRVRRNRVLSPSSP